MSTTPPPEPPSSKTIGPIAINVDEVRAWVKANPEATQVETAKHFKCSTPTLRRHVPGLFKARGFKKGPEWNGNRGGKPALLPVVVGKLRDLTPGAIDALEAGLDCKDQEERRKTAVAVLQLGYGRDMGARVPVDDGASEVDLVQKLEARALSLALEGDLDDVLAVLAVKAPEKWGKKGDPGDGDDKKPTRINLVRDGQARSGKKLDLNDGDDASEEA